MKTDTYDMNIVPTNVDKTLPPQVAVALDHSLAEDRIRQIQAARSGKLAKPRVPHQVMEGKSKDTLLIAYKGMDSHSDKPYLLRVPVDALGTSANQPRRAFDPDALQELAASVKMRGVLQPILVRPAPAATMTAKQSAPAYEIVAGERRWRASQEAGLEDVPVLVQKFSDAAAAEIGLIENLQRADLTPLETAAALARMAEQGYSVRKLADRLGKQKGWVEQHLLLVRLPEDLQAMVSERPDTLTHARELKKVSDETFRAELIASVVDLARPLSLVDLRRRIRKAQQVPDDQAFSQETDNSQEASQPEDDQNDSHGISQRNGSLGDLFSKGTVQGSAVGARDENEADEDKATGDIEVIQKQDSIDETKEGINADRLLHQEAFLANVRSLRRKLPDARVPVAVNARKSLVEELSALRDAIATLLGDWGVTN